MCSMRAWAARAEERITSLPTKGIIMRIFCASRGAEHGRANTRVWSAGLAGLLAASLFVGGCVQAPDDQKGEAVASSAERVTAAAPRAVSGLALATTSVPGGGTVTGTVQLVGIDGSTPVTLTVDLPGLASVPATILVPSGVSAGSFTIVTSGVSAATTVRISATAGGA